MKCDEQEDSDTDSDEHIELTEEEVHRVEITVDDYSYKVTHASMIFWAKMSEICDPSTKNVDPEKLYARIVQLASPKGYILSRDSDYDDPDDWGTYKGKTYCRFYVHVTKTRESSDEEDSPSDDEE